MILCSDIHCTTVAKNRILATIIKQKNEAKLQPIERSRHSHLRHSVGVSYGFTFRKPMGNIKKPISHLPPPPPPGSAGESWCTQIIRGKVPAGKSSTGKGRLRLK